MEYDLVCEVPELLKANAPTIAKHRISPAWREPYKSVIVYDDDSVWCPNDGTLIDLTLIANPVNRDVKAADPRSNPKRPPK